TARAFVSQRREWKIGIFWLDYLLNYAGCARSSKAIPSFFTRRRGRCSFPRETTAGSAGDAGGGAPEVDFLNQKPTPIVVPTPPVLCPAPEYDDACAAGRSRFACWGGEGSALPFRRDNWGLLFWLGFSSSF